MHGCCLSPPRSLPANNQLFLPRATQRSERSAALFVSGVTHADKAANLPTDADALRALVLSMTVELEAVTSERNALTAERGGLLERLERQQHLLLKLTHCLKGNVTER